LPVSMSKMKKIYDIISGKLISFDQACLKRRFYMIIAISLVLIINFLLVYSFEIQKDYSNFSEIRGRSIILNSRTTIQFPFIAQEGDLSSFQIYKNMEDSRVSYSDKALIRIENDEEVIFETEAYLFHNYRNYITVNCNGLDLKKGERYIISLSASEMSLNSVCYLQAHDYNDFLPEGENPVNRVLPVGVLFIPNVTFHYNVLHFPYLIANQTIFMLLVCILFISRLRHSAIFLEIMRAVLVPFILFLTQEVLNVAKMAPIQVFFPFDLKRYFGFFGAMVIFILVYFLFYAIVGRGTIAMIIMVIAGVSIGLANHFKIIMRGDPAVPWDIFAAGIAAKISTNYVFKVSIQFVCAILLIVLIAIVLRMTHTPPRKSIRRRILFFGICAVAFSGFIFGIILNRPLLKRYDISYELFPPLQSYNENGTMMALALHLNHFYKTGENVDVDVNIADITDAYKVRWEALQEGNGKSSSDIRPNVICIMSEAFSDVRELRDTQTNIPFSPFYDSLKEEAMNGKLAVSVFGGGTCNTEFEFLTGFSVRNLLAGSSVYNQYVHKSLPTALPNVFKENGYQTLAIHPFDGAWWNRSEKYPFLGFDRFLTQEDFVEPSYTREYISDAEAFSRLIEEYEKKDQNTKLFSFLVTMQNHADYTNAWDSQKYDIKIENFAGYDFSATEHYLSLLRESDDALKDLITYFQNEDEPTIIVFFGDHKPFLDPDFYSTLLEADLGNISIRECVDIYTTPYFVWANYPLDLEDQSIISPNLLGQRVLDMAGVSYPDERAILGVMQNEMDALSAIAVYESEDSFYTSDDILPEALRKLLSDYAAMQYEMLFSDDS